MTHARQDVTLQQITGVPPLTFTAYSASGAMLHRWTGVTGPASFAIPKDISKRVARTEVMDATGAIINEWTAPADYPCWPKEAKP